MYLKSLILVLLAFISLSACKPDIEDHEVSGVLTVDKSVFGNVDLEINDVDSNMTRFIHPGKKILKIEQSNSKVNITLMESGRAKLARLELPYKLVQIDGDVFYVKGTEIRQNWDVRFSRTKKILQLEYLPKRYSQTCMTPAGPGLTGVVFEVKDYRYDYDVRFLHPSLEKDVAHMVASGEFRTDTNIVTLTDCRPAKIVVSTEQVAP